MSKIDIDKFVASLLKAPEGWNEWAIDSEDIKKALADQHLEYKDGEIVSTVYVSGNYSLSISNTKLGTITGGGTYTIPIEPQSNEKQGEQKPFDYEHATITQKDFAPQQEWSKEDENRFQNIIACIEDCYNEKDAQDLIRWFKSLRHQPKQVWSEDDEEMAEDVIKGCVSAEKAHHFIHTPKEVSDWLISLKNRMKGKED